MNKKITSVIISTIVGVACIAAVWISKVSEEAVPASSYAVMSQPMTDYKVDITSADIPIIEVPTTTVQVDMVSYSTGEPIYTFPENMSPKVQEYALDWALTKMDEDSYEDCTVIECCFDPWENGWAVHYVFDNKQYICMWFSCSLDTELTLYDTPITPFTFGDYTDL